MLLPVLSMMSCDIALTLLGQPSWYWMGDPESVQELNPLARWLLQQSPWLFLSLAILWMVLVSVVLLFWRHRFTKWIALVFTFAHAIGASTWLIRLGALGWFGAVALLFVAERLWRLSRPG